MKNENSIDRIIQVNDTNIGNNIAALRKSLNIKYNSFYHNIPLPLSTYLQNYINTNKLRINVFNPTAKKNNIYETQKLFSINFIQELNA